MTIKNLDLTGNKSLLISSIMLLCLVLIPVFASCITPYDPLMVDLNMVKQPPSAAHWLGTDTLGRDILSRIIYGSRVSLVIGLCSTLFSMCIGMFTGLISGYFGGKLDVVLTGVTDLFLAFPSLLLAIGISVLLPPGVMSTILVLCLVGWASFARLFRAMILSLKENLFVDSALAAGSSSLRIIFSHLLPHCIPIALTAALLVIPFTVIHGLISLGR